MPGEGFKMCFEMCPYEHLADLSIPDCTGEGKPLAGPGALRAQGKDEIMVYVKPLPDEEAEFAIANLEFDARILASSPFVAVIMTQDWCFQWTSMSGWLDRNPQQATLIDEDCSIYTLIYNQKTYFREFLHFKETVWKNDRIPYVRYYKKGAFLMSSNFVSREQFFRNFQ
jgi:hypothetical protein